MNHITQRMVGIGRDLWRLSIVNLHLALGELIFVPEAVTFGMCSVFVKMAISSLLRIVQPMKQINLWY